MKRKIPVHELRKGMYVSELDRPWVGTPFLFQGFEIRTDEELGQLRELCQFVYVTDGDEDRGDTTPESRATQTRTGKHNVVGHAAPPGAVGRTRFMPADNTKSPSGLVLPALPSKSDARRVLHYQDQTSVEEELDQAREIEAKTRDLIFSIIDDVRIGRSFHADAARQSVASMTESIIRNPDALVWLTQLKQKNEYTATHSLRVCILALSFARHLNFTREQMEMLGTGALLHDIGKIKVPNEIIDKPERLTDAEYSIMKKHVPWGADILANTKGFPAHAIEVARCHHERYSGTGYIMGLSGDDIGIYGLIAAIVDTYDALTSDRAYRAGTSAAEALKIIYEGRNNMYHPALVEQFIQCLGIFPLGSVVEMNTGSIGVVITVNRARRLRPRIALVLRPDKQPLSPAVIIDLMKKPRDDSGRLLEIKNVLAAGQYGIDPTQYIPLTQKAG